MNVLVIGSDGFIGQALVDRLIESVDIGGRGPATGITLLDRRVAARSDPRVRAIQGDLRDRATLERAIEGGVDVVFNLVSIPGGASERDFELGMSVNLQAMITLLEVLRVTGKRPRLVYASSVGVYGVPLPDVIDEQTVPEPSLSYGAHKYVGEILVADYSRKGFIDGVSLRLPGIVARPQADGNLSFFLSELIRRPAAGEAFTCPVSADGKSWWMSRAQVVDNFLHAARLGQDRLAKRRTFLLPVLHLSAGEVVDGVAEAFGVDARSLVSYEPDDKLQAQFANLPPMHCPNAEAAGFRHDGDAVTLVKRALQ